MPHFDSCHHVHPNGAYCGSPALRERKYCYYHLEERRRRLRRVRALRDNLPYRLEIPSLDSRYAIRNAISEIAQAIAAGQLEPIAAGKLLYAIQLAAANNRRIEQMEAVPQVRAPQLGANLGSGEPGGPQLPAVGNCGDLSRVQEYPDFEAKFGLPPGADLDAETEAVLQQADEEAQLRQRYSMPDPPAGVRVGSPAYRIYREEAYQMLHAQVNQLRHQLRDYNQQKRQQLEATVKKEMMSAIPSPDSTESPSGIQGVVREDTGAKKPPTSLAAELKKEETAETA